MHDTFYLAFETSRLFYGTGQSQYFTSESNLYMNKLYYKLLILSISLVPDDLKA